MVKALHHIQIHMQPFPGCLLVTWVQPSLASLKIQQQVGLHVEVPDLVLEQVQALLLVLVHLKYFHVLLPSCPP